MKRISRLWEPIGVKTVPSRFSSGKWPGMMTAVRKRGSGGPEVLRLEDVDRPEPLPAEVLTRVRTTSINAIDHKTREGSGPLHSPPGGRLHLKGGWGDGPAQAPRP